MLLELYVILEIIGILVAGLAFLKRNPLVWGLACIFFAILGAAAFDVEQRSTVVTNSTTTLTGGNYQTSYNYSDFTTTKPVYPLFGLNLGLFAICIVFLFYDMFNEVEFKGK